MDAPPFFLYSLRLSRIVYGKNKLLPYPLQITCDVYGKNKLLPYPLQITCDVYRKKQAAAWLQVFCFVLRVPRSSILLRSLLRPPSG